MVVYLMPGTYYGPARVNTRATKDSPAAIRAVDGAEVVVTYSSQWVKAEAEKLLSVEPSTTSSTGPWAKTARASTIRRC
jgi:hypothetical protein